MRSVHEGARERARDIAASNAYLVSRRQRLRGPNGAKEEFHLAAAAQNLRKMSKMRPMPGLAAA